MTEAVWAFVYDIELSSEQNPPGTMDRLREELRTFFVAHNMKYGMGALGGSRHCYGTVQATEREIAENARQAISDWVKTQRISGIARFGSAKDTEPKLLAPITDMVFAMDNLTEEDRCEAARYHTDIRKRIESQSKKPT